MRLAERKEGKYLPFDVQMLPTDNMEQIYVTHDPAAESLDSVRFDIRSPHTCHMSSVAYLERTLEFMILARPPRGGGFVHHFHPMNPANQENGRSILVTKGNATRLAIRLNSPGFSLQNVMKRFTMTFKDGTVIDEPSSWLPQYSHLYQVCLANYVNASGRAFLHGRFMGNEGLDMVSRASIDRMFNTDLLTHGEGAVDLAALHEYHNDTGIEVDTEEVRLGPPVLADDPNDVILDGYLVFTQEYNDGFHRQNDINTAQELS